MLLQEEVEFNNSKFKKNGCWLACACAPEISKSHTLDFFDFANQSVLFVLQGEKKRKC
jgi:hypothetical protein